MMKFFNSHVFATVLLATFVFAQEPLTPEPSTDLSQPTAESQPEPAAVDQALESEPVEPEPVPMEPVVEAPVPEPVPAVTEAAAEPSPVITTETARSVAASVAKSSEPLDIKFRAGVRLGAGLSSFRGHKAFNFETKALKPGPSLSAGAGIAFEFEFNDLFSLAPELQYTLYRAGGEYTIKNGADFMDVNEAGIRLHALELPVLCRFSISQAYAEIGPQIGLNLDTRAYKNSSTKRPDLKTLAFGPSIGGGVKIDGLLVGVRGYLGILEYAKNTNGYPWVIQVSATQFFF